MPRPKKGPRLWFRDARTDAAGKTIGAGQWLILDGTRQIGTGKARDEAEAAQRDLARYILERASTPRSLRDIESIEVATVLAIYDEDCREGQANKAKFDERLRRLNAWWGRKRLAEVNGESCRAYARERGTAGGARRDLEDLRAAINHHGLEGLHRGQVRVLLPPKGPARERWLTRGEAAKLIWTCWRYREVQTRSRGRDAGKKLPTNKRPLRHLARFILIALYTGTRAGAVAAASPYRSEGRSWVDLEAGLFYRLPEGQKATNKRQPPAPIPDHLLAHMRRWKRTAIATSHFVEFNGAPIADPNKGFAHAVELAGLEGKVIPHTLRHTAATWLMQNGVEIWEAAGFLGMSEKVLRDTYGHHHPTYLRNAASSFRRRRPPANEIPMKTRDETRTDVDKPAQPE